MKMSRLLLAGAGFGIAALAFRRKRYSRVCISGQNFDKRDATLLGKKSHQTDIGGLTSSHIKEGIARTSLPPKA